MGEKPRDGAMEMVEGHNQSKIVSKRIKFHKVVDQGNNDRISGLPDCVLHEILSRLPSTKEAIRTGTLSKRWKHVWTSVHSLVFIDSNNFRTRCRQNPKSFSDFILFVDKTLTQCRELKLKKFIVHTCYDIRFESYFNNWVRYAISCNVEKLNITSWYNPESKFLLDKSIFIGSCITHMRLVGCMFNRTKAISWKNLRRLSIIEGELDEDLIENIFSGSPVLETLKLFYCYGFRRLNITSKSVKNLEFFGYVDPDDDLPDSMEINAPNIQSLKIQGGLWLWKLLLVNVSSEVKVDLDYYQLRYRNTRCAKTEEDMLKGCILNLRHVKEVEIKIVGFCAEVLSRLEAKGFVSPSNIKLV